MSDQKFPGRHLYLGPSEAAAACGVGSYCDPLELWEIKTLRRVQPESTPVMERGNWVEPVVLSRLRDDYGVGIYSEQGEAADPIRPFLRGHCDGMIKSYVYIGDGFALDSADGPGICEIKAPGSRACQNYAREGLPAEYIVQVQLYMHLFKVKWASVFFLDYDTNTIKQIDLVRDDKFIAAVLRQVEDFWSFVEADEPPPSRNVELRIPGPAEDRSVSIDDEGAASSFLMAKAAVDSAEEALAEAEDELKLLMMEHDTTSAVVSGMVKLTWREHEVRSVDAKPLRDWTDALVDAVVCGRADEYERMCKNWCSDTDMFIKVSKKRPFLKKAL